MVKIVRDEEYWRHRAEEARAMEEQIRNPKCKRIMRKMAQAYDRLGGGYGGFSEGSQSAQSFKIEASMNGAHALADDYA
jgi:hypothetical protein